MPASDFNLNSLKGRLAEQLVQDMFLQSNFNVFNYGIERVMPGFARVMNGISRSKINRNLRFMPDFVVQSLDTGELFYLEVKFRANGRFRLKDLPDDYPYKNAWFIIVSPQKIQCIHYNRLHEEYEITPTTHYNLKGIKCFSIDDELLKEYEKYAGMLFKGFSKEQLI